MSETLEGKCIDCGCDLTFDELDELGNLCWSCDSLRDDGYPFDDLESV